MGTWKDENWREIRHGEIRAKEVKNEQKEEREDLKKRVKS